MCTCTVLQGKRVSLNACKNGSVAGEIWDTLYRNVWMNLWDISLISIT